MSEEKKNRITTGGTAATPDRKDSSGAFNGGASSQKNAMSISHIGKDERDERSALAQARIRENIERAGKAAQASRENAEIRNEYRKSILEREDKRADAMRRERDLAEREARRKRAEKLDAEREDYLKREREENARMSEGVQNIFAKLEKPSHVGGGSAIKSDELESASAKKGLNTEFASGYATAGDSASGIGRCADERITLSIGSQSNDSAYRPGISDDSMVINIGGRVQNTPSRHDIRVDGETLRIGSSATSHNYSYIPPRVDFYSEIRAAEERHFARRREAFAVAAGTYSEELRLLAEEEARYAAEIAEIKARRSEYRELISDLEGGEIMYGDSSSGNPTRDRSHPDASADRRANEYERHNESNLASDKLGEEDLVREYDRYVASMERGVKEQSRTRPTGEALPYTEKAEYQAPADLSPSYDELDYTSISDTYHPQKEPYANEFGDRGDYIPMGYGVDHDRHAVREYEAEMMRRKEAESRIGAKNARTAEELSELDQKQLEETEKSSQAYRAEGMALYAKSQLSKKLDKFHKEEAALLKKEKRLISAQVKASPEENVQLIVEKIAIAKELCEMSADVLSASVYVGSGARIGKYKRVLTDYIDRYNRLCDEYEGKTGRALDRIDDSMVSDVMAGRLYSPIQNVYYYGMEDDLVHSGITPSIDRERRIEAEDTLVREEYARYIDEGSFPEPTVHEKHAAAKKRSQRMGIIRRATERDLLLISLRSEYRINTLQAKRDILTYSFDLEKKDRQREIRKIDKNIGRIRAAERKAADLERADNSRYYYLAAVDPSEEKVKNGARRERLESLRLRLDVLLSERESINESLIALYGGSDTNLKRTRVARKAGGVRKKAAKAMYNRQRELARKIDKIKAPIDMKERAIELLNKSIEDAAEFESARYTLKALNPGGAAREELYRTLARAKANLKADEREIKFIMKKLKKHEERYRDDREWAGFLITLAVLVCLGIAGWYFFGDRILAYIAELRAYFGF